MHVLLWDPSTLGYYNKSAHGCILYHMVVMYTYAYKLTLPACTLQLILHCRLSHLAYHKSDLVRSIVFLGRQDTLIVYNFSFIST